MINEEKISADLTVNLIMIPDYMRLSISQENCVVYLHPPRHGTSRNSRHVQQKTRGSVEAQCILTSALGPKSFHQRKDDQQGARKDMHITIDTTPQNQMAMYGFKSWPEPGFIEHLAS